MIINIFWKKVKRIFGISSNKKISSIKKKLKIKKWIKNIKIDFLIEI